MEKTKLQNIIEKNDSSLDIEDLEKYSLYICQYEHNGVIDYDKFLTDMVLEEEEIDNDDLIRYYREYKNEYEYYDSFYEFYEFFEFFYQNAAPEDIASDVYFGHIEEWGCDYLKYNGNGNIEQVREDDLIEEIKENPDFILWAIEEYNIFNMLADENNKTAILEAAYEYIKEGY